jgi:hypothetical protein
MIPFREMFCIVVRSQLKYMKPVGLQGEDRAENRQNHEKKYQCPGSIQKSLPFDYKSFILVGTLSGLIHMIQAEHIVGQEFVLVQAIIWSTRQLDDHVKENNAPSLMYVGCLKVTS